MANTRSANVIRVDTTANFAEVINIVGIKYVGAASGTAVIEAGGTDSGIVLWEHDGDVFSYEQVCIRDNQGVRVEVTNSAVVYLYLK